MSSAIFSFEFDDAQKFAKLTAPDNFYRHMRRHIPRTTGLNARLAADKIKRVLRSGSSDMAKNASLTIMIKDSSRPLIDVGDFVHSITAQKIDDWTAWVGISSDHPEAGLMQMLHEGATIRVTPAMRGMFFMLWKASTGQMDSSKLTGRAAELFARQPAGWLPLKETTTAIVIPGRPWTKIASEDTGLKQQMKSNWEMALQSVFRDMKKESGL